MESVSSKKNMSRKDAVRKRDPLKIQNAFEEESREA